MPTDIMFDLNFEDLKESYSSLSNGYLEIIRKLG